MNPVTAYILILSILTLGNTITLLVLLHLLNKSTPSVESTVTLKSKVDTPPAMIVSPHSRDAVSLIDL